jgi:hypothetical protein
MDKKKKEINWLKWISIIASLLIITAWICTYYQLKDLDPNVRGTFGDMFGSINALFSGLALAGIIITILLQQKELRLQRQELSETRQEFKIQNETLRIQRFENTFFNLLNIHHKIVSDIDYRYYKDKEKDQGLLDYSFQTKTEDKEVVVIEGRDVFRFRFNRFKESVIDDEKGWLELYKEHYELAQTDFGHYFRNLYRMVKLVDTTDFFYDKNSISDIDIFKTKYKYTSIIRAQVSDYELAWLFYNCLSSNGIEKFKPLIEKYSLLKNLPDNLIIDVKNHKNLYYNFAFEPETNS